MNIQVLISCMYQKDFSIIERSNIQTDTIIVNQCDKNETLEFRFCNKAGKECKVKFINTKERGLSRSRNMAIANAWGDICYLCDDDEYLEDEFNETILKAYESHPEKDIIIFAVKREKHIYPEIEKKVGLRQLLRTSSVQTTFRRSAIIDNNIQFDVLMGSGSGNGGGEENKFLMDCRRKSLSIYYVPAVISTVLSEDSQWFKGFTSKYFKDTGWSVRRILGVPLGFTYLIYWALIRSRDFEIHFSKLKILKLFLLGFFEKR